MEDIRKQAAIHLAAIKGHNSNWTKQVHVYEQDLGMIEKHLLQQDDSFGMESQQIWTRIEESGKKPGLLLVDMNKLENTILSMLETLKERDNRRKKWMDIANQSLNRRIDQQHSWLSTKKKAFKEMDRERNNEFMKSKGRLLDENIEAVHLLNKARKALKENNKRVTDDITRLKGDLEELGIEEKKCINGWRRELKNYLEAVSKQRQEEDRKESEKFQRNKESCQQSKRNVRFCEPERRDVDSYLAFDKNRDKFANQLSKLDLYLHDIPGDGNCLFRALGDQLEGHQENYFKHRCDVVEYMVKHRDTFEPFVEDGIPFKRYISWLRKKGTHAGNDAIVAFAKLHHLNVAIHQLSQPILMIHGVKDSTIARELHIAYHNGEHYSSVRRIDAKTTVHHKDRLASRHTEGSRCSQYKDQSSHQMGKPRSQMDIEKQHKDSRRKIETSWSRRSSNQADVLKLSKGQGTHQEVKKTIHKHVPRSVPRDENSLGQETLRIKLRDENSLRQETQKGVLKDGKSPRHEALKDTYVRNPTSSMNIEGRTLDENYHYTSNMTMKEFSDYFNSQDMTVMEFAGTKEFFDYSVSNSMTSFHLVKELKNGQWTQAKKQIEVESTTQIGAVDSKEPKVLHEKELDTQLNRKSDVLKRNSQDCGQNKVTQSDGKNEKRNGMDPEVGYSLQVYSGEEYSSGVSTEEPRGLQFAIQERDTSTILVMHDAHCSKEYAAKMTELDEQSDLGHQDHLSIREVIGSAHLESKDVSIHKSEPRIIKSVHAEESPHVKIGLGYQVTPLQTVVDPHNSCIPDCKVKDSQVYIPPHRRSDQDWQEHVKKGFQGLQWNATSKAHLRSAENSDHQKGQLKPVIRSANDSVRTKDKHTASLPKDIPGKVEAHTHSGGSSRNSTQSVEIQVNMEFLKPVLKDASVQCEQMERPSGLNTSTSTDDFEAYLQSQQEDSLYQKPLEDGELAKSITPVMCNIQSDADMGCCIDSASLIDSETSDQLECGQPTSSSTPLKDGDELVHNMDSGIHASDGEVDSFNELMSMHDPMLSSSPLVILNPETVLQGLHKDINSLFQTRNRNLLGSHGIPNIQCTLVEEVSIDQCLAASLIWGRILFNMELLRSQRCKDPLKGSGLV